MPRWVGRVFVWFRTEWAAHRKIHLIDALQLAQREALSATRQAADLRRRLELRIWLDIQMKKQNAELERQVSHWCQRTIHEEGVTRQALEDREEAIQRVLYLEKELEDTVRSRDELITIADKQIKKARR